MSSKKIHAKLPLDKARAYEIADWGQVTPLFKATRLIANPTYVYFIGQKDGPLKIGLAKDPVARLRGMQTGNPVRLRIEAAVVGDIGTERLFHDLWAEYAIYSDAVAERTKRAPGTEWFKPEIRDGLIPIVEAISDAQAAYFRDTDPEEFYLAELEQIVRRAHVDADHVAQGRDHVYLLGDNVGSRPSRI